MRTVSFSVDGVPQPQGSKRHVGNGVMVESAKGLRPWRRKVREAAEEAMGDEPWLDGPLAVLALFVFERPGYHYRTGRFAGQVKDSAPLWHTKTPDGDKLLRAVGDSLTGVVYGDDSRIAASIPLKVYGETAGVHVRVVELAP